MIDDQKAGHGKRLVDPVTGYETTGHNWNGILELNTPMSRIAVVALVLSVLYSVVTWILLPAWPIGKSATPGLLGLEQGPEAVAVYDKIRTGREHWMEQFDGKPDFAALASDAPLMLIAMPGAHRLFEDNCAACHGMNGTGGPGFPDLADKTWLWGGDPATVAETITIGINGTDPDTRVAAMPSFDWMSEADRKTLATWVSELPSGKAAKDDPAAKLFADNCATCHGDNAGGGLDNGAPSLTDKAVLFGQDEATVMQTLAKGRSSTMPSWTYRLTPQEINLLALYVTRLSSTEGAAQ